MSTPNPSNSLLFPFNSPSRIETETHVDSLFVTELAHDDSSRVGPDQVGSKVGGLKTSRLELGDSKDGLEVLVQDVEETVGETPEEEEGGDESESHPIHSTRDWGRSRE